MQDHKRQQELREQEAEFKRKEEEAKVECKQCGNRWTPRTANPKCCTKCKRYDWNKK